MGKIGDLWVRLGLKSEDYKKGLNQAKKETDGFGTKLDKMKAGAVAVWAAIGAAVIKVSKDIVTSTNAIGDAWAQTASKAKASYQSVIAQMTTNNKREKGWWLRLFNPNDSAGYDVGANAKAAGEAAAKMTAAFDAEFELANSVKLQKGAIQQELNELYVAMRDTTLSPSARKSAMQRYKSLLQPLAKAEIDVYQNMVDSAVSAWQAGNSDILSREYSSAEVTDFLSTYGTNPSAAKSKYGELADVYENRKNDEANAQLVDVISKLQAAQAQMSNIDKEMIRVSSSIKKALSPEVVLDELEELDDELIELDLEIPEIKTDALDAALQEIQQNAEKYRKELDEIAQYNEALEGTIISATSNSMQALTDMMFGLEGADMKNVLAAFLAPFGDTMKQMGSMIMAEGIAMSAFKKSFSNPVAAIAAGAALIAIGSAVSSGLQALTANPSGGGGGSSYGGNSYGNSEAQNYESTLTVEVTGKLSGSDIVISGRKQQDKWNR
jgi:hypothetical protein